jgi:hypothetical protein
MSGRPWLLGLVPIWGLIAGCDLPPSARNDGPQVVGISPDPDGGDIDRRAQFRIALDRRVAPGSVAQGVVAITSGAEYVWGDLSIEVAEPAILLTPWGPLDPDVDYQLVLHAVRDLDGHTSSDTDPVVFHTSTTSTPAIPDAITYADVAPIFESCAAAGCHSGSDAILGLDLSSAAAIRATALGVTAREVRPSVGGYLDVDVSSSLVGMPLLDRRSPARSYLVYTMLGDPHIAGSPMPPDGALASAEEIALVERWIRAGVPRL